MDAEAVYPPAPFRKMSRIPDIHTLRPYTCSLPPTFLAISHVPQGRQIAQEPRVTIPVTHIFLQRKTYVIASLLLETCVLGEQIRKMLATHRRKGSVMHIQERPITTPLPSAPVDPARV